LRIKWHGHACWEIENADGLRIVTDPHDGKAIGIKPPLVEAEIVLMSHDHFDHNCDRIVQGADKEVVTGAGARTVKGIPIIGVHSYHDEDKGSKRGENIMFNFEVDGIKVCHLGDLGEQLDKAQIDGLGDIDIMFIPVGGTFTVDAKGAWKVIKILNPKVVVPMHFRVGGLSLSIAPVDGFLEKVKKDAIHRVGNEIELTKEDIPEEQQIWVFSM
jgi:L-ascorbate metabolism protein UlaG (beta-lactamase superfamily)